LRLYWKYLKKILPLFILSIICMAVEAGVELLQPTLMADIIDVGVASGDLSYVLHTSGLMLAAVAAYAVVAFLRNILSIRGAQYLSAYLRSDAYAKIQSLKPDELDRFGAGTLMTRITNDISQVQNMTMGLMRIALRAPILCIGGIIMAMRLNMELAVIPIICCFIISGIIMLNMKYGFPLFAKVQTALDNVNTVIREYLSGIRVVKAFNRFSFEVERFSGPNEELRHTSTFASRVMAIFNPLINLVIYGAIVVLLWIGGLKVNSGNVHAGQIIAFITYMTQILQSMNMLSNIFQRFVRTNASCKRLEELFDAESLPELDKNVKPDLEKGLDFHNVSFAYAQSTGRAALTDVSFSCGVGERVGVIGATGSGKTTLINLVLQFYQPTAGSIRIFGMDAADVDPGIIRQHLAVVPQRVVLFTGTILENIRWGNETASFEEVVAAAKAAHAHDFIMSFPEGYDTLIGHSGVNLSGGQRQRVAIARALIKKPRILILDDCLSALDALTEASIRDELARDVKCGSLVVSQKISSLLDCDRIVVLDDGACVGVGKHTELLETCQVYRDIYLSQYGAEALHNQPGKEAVHHG